MVPKIYARSVMMMGREPQHSLMVIIPRKIWEALQINKGTRLYFKLEENGFVVSKDVKFLEDNLQDRDAGESIELKKENGNIIVDGISLADLQY
ncbi:MAG: hypothetical protein ACREA7_01455 [Nitrosotalea sp.]